MAEGSATVPKAGRRRIIERPRLTRLLDESPARIKMLVAPAGYGKTTLARQWLATGERRSAWLICRRSSADVAALAEAIATAARPLVPDFGAVVLDRLAATEVPAHELDVLAELMLEELERWPTDAWLVVDEYHLIGDSPAAEFFFGEIATSPSLNLVIISRTRPAWATARRLIYGEIAILGRGELEMTDNEAHELLDPAFAQTIASRVLGSRWPALLGLAALAGGMPDERPIPSSVYEFLAEELFASLSPRAKEAALAIVAMPRMDRDTAVELLGMQSSGALADACAAGMLDLPEQSRTIEMHPLIRDFLLSKWDTTSSRHAEHLFQILIDKHRWDDAFSLVQDFLPQRLEELLRSALPELLSRARVQTLSTWLRFGESAGIKGPACEHAAAELAFREGAHLEAFAAARALARRLPDHDEMKARVLLLVGRAAHLASLEDESREAYQLSKELARTREVRRAAMWGEIAATVDLELPDAEKLLAEAERECDTLADVINHSTQTLAFGVRSGKVRGLDTAQALVATATRLSDPLLRCSFLSGLGSALAIAGEYDECIRVTGLLVAEAERHRLDFVIPYALASRAIGYVGLKEIAKAFDALDQAGDYTRRRQDKHCILNVAAIRSRAYFAMGKFDEALAALEIDVEGAIPSMAAEVAASRGLALAAVGRVEQARELARQASALSSTVETKVLACGVEAICAIRVEPAVAPDAVRNLIESSFRSGNLDSLAIIYRGLPDILAHVPPAIVDDLMSVLRKVGDDELEAVVRGFVAKQTVGFGALSPRERDVAELLRQGLSNKEIGARLFISPATAKLHVRRIFEKLDVRTRTEAALKLAALQSGKPASPDEATE